MKKLVTNLFIFATGAAIGSLVTWKIIKTKYEKIADEEILSVKEVYQKRLDRHEEENNSKETIQKMGIEYPNDSIKKAVEISKKEGYYTLYKEGDKSYMEEPYVIAPEEFGECDYKTVSLTYYADGVVTNEKDKPIKDINKLIGEDSLNHFGEYEDDSVFVRNDALKIDYEILADLRNYSDL